MTPTCWMDWCTKQMGDLSRRLVIQGYDPASIERLRRTNRGFERAFTRFEREFGAITDAMATNPDGYHHYEALNRAKTDLLTYTCAERGVLLQDPLARTA